MRSALMLLSVCGVVACEPGTCDADEGVLLQAKSLIRKHKQTPPTEEFDSRLSAYWDTGTCGAEVADDYHWAWCGGTRASESGNCPTTISTDTGDLKGLNICDSGVAELAEYHGTGDLNSYTRDGCNYYWHAQYRCTEAETAHLGVNAASDPCVLSGWTSGSLSGLTSGAMSDYLQCLLEDCEDASESVIEALAAASGAEVSTCAAAFSAVQWYEQQHGQVSDPCNFDLFSLWPALPRDNLPSEIATAFHFRILCVSQCPTSQCTEASVADLWPQYEVDLSKCNHNENSVLVGSQEECQALAVENGHEFYSYRHNAGTGRGSDPDSDEHKCFSSADCNDGVIGVLTNEWNIYRAPDGI